MNPTPLLLIRRRLLKVSPTGNITQISNFLSPTTPAADGREFSFLPVNNGSTTSGRKPFNSNTHFDSSMALTILVLLTALFFMGFFSVYIRRFASGGAASSGAPAAPRRPEESGNQRRGLDPSVVPSLPLVDYSKHRGAAGECPICLSEFEDGETVKLIPYCGHVFHGGCVDTWLASHVTCPLCRSAQLFKTADREGVLLGCDAAQV